MKIKKRSKRSRLRGARTCGWGFRKKHKGGRGEAGGRGMGGSGKSKRQKVHMEAIEKGFKTYFGKQGITSVSTKKKKEKKINLCDVKEKFGEKDKIDLKDFKILGKGEGFKSVISAKAASKGAIEKMKKAGGSIEVPVVEDNLESNKETKKDIKIARKQIKERKVLTQEEVEKRTMKKGDRKN